VESLQDELARIVPKEVVLPASVPDDPSHPVISLLKEESMFYSFAPVQAPADRSTSDDTSIESASIFLLSEYLHSNLLESAPTLESPTHKTDSTLMQIDAHTIKSLEIREASYVGGTKGTLVSVIRRTTTDSGSRLLARRLCRSPSFASYTTRLLTVFPGCPSTSLEEIESWQSTVAFFVKRPHLRADIIEKLKEMGDVSRIVQRFTLKRGDVPDLLSVKKTIDLCGDILKALELESVMEKRREGFKEEWKCIDVLRKRMLNLESLSTRIEVALPDVSDTSPTIEDAEEKALAQDSAPSETPFKWAINPS
jgi:DNA mismatch repair ATPase MutS